MWESGMPWTGPDLQLEENAQLRYEQWNSLLLVRKCERCTITLLVSVHQCLPVEFTFHFIPRMTFINTISRNGWVQFILFKREVFHFSLQSLKPILECNARLLL